jgi:hypothetical protein
MSAAIALAGGSAATAGSERRLDDLSGLALSRSAEVKPARAVNLPPLKIPLRPLSEPPDGDDRPPGAQMVTVSAPAQLHTPGRRSVARLDGVPAIGGTLAGLGSAVINPADAQLGVGPSDVVEMVNSNINVWTKTGAFRSTDTLGSFFSTTADDRRLDQMSDPRVIYDTQSGRWFSLAMDVTKRQTVLAITDTADPNGGRWIYTFQSYGCPDQPRLGVSDNLVAFGDNYFSDCGSYGQLIGGEVTVLDKGQLTSHAQQVGEIVYGPSPFFSSVTPVQSLSSTGTLYFVASDFFFDAIDLFATASLQSPSLPVQRLFISSLFPAPDALQSDPLLINTGDNRIQNAVWENGNLWLAISDGCNVNGEIGVHACGRFVGINTDTRTVTMEKEVALAGDRDLFYPAIMPASDGTLYAVFGYSSAAETPGIAVIANPSDPNANWETITQGAGANESGRWGDYFGIARDPSDGTHVWVAGPYGTGGASWSSTVAAIGQLPFSITPPTAPPPTSKPAHKPAKKPKKKPKKKHHG